MKSAPFPPNEAERIAALHEANVLDTLPEAAFDDLTRMAAAICGTPIAVVSLVDEGRQWFKSKVGLDAPETPRDVAFCAHAILEEKIFEVPDAATDERFADNPLVTGGPRIRFYAGAPLIVRDKLAVGTLCVIDDKPRQLTEEQREALRALARQAVAQLELRRANTRLERVNAELLSAAMEARTAIHNMRLYRQIADNIQIGLHIYRLEEPSDPTSLRMLYVNSAAEDSTGVAAADVMGKRILDGFPAAANTELPSIYADVARSGQGAELGVVHYDDERIHDQYFRVTAFPLPERAMGVSFENITERRKGEERLRLYGQVIEHMPSGLIVWRLEHEDDPGSLRFVFANRAAARIFRRPFEEMNETLAGRALRDVFPSSLENGSAARYAEVARTGQVLDLGEIRQEPAGNVPTGYFHVTAFPLPDRSVGIAFEDISHRKAVERMKSEFVSTVSHELRTPLTSIRGALGLLEGRILGELPAEAMEVVQIARTNSDRLIRLINDILDLEKIEAGKLELKQGPVDVRRLLQSTMEGLRPMADEASVALVADAHARADLVGDEDRLMQVLTNLVSNAIKFSPRGEAVSIRVETRSSGRMRFSIADRGPGIAEADMPRLFGKFQQLDTGDSRRKGGTGLGLAICKAIIEQHGGTIGVQSTVGEGSTFWFELPVTLPHASSAEAKNGVVLVVEDELTVARILLHLVAEEGFEARGVGTLAAATQFCDENVPAAVLLDLGLPDGDGLSLIEHLRKDPRTYGVPVLVVTGREPTAGSFATPLLVDWLNKPFDQGRLSSTLRWAAHPKVTARVLVVEDDASFRDLLVRQLSVMGAECVVASDGEEAVRLARAASPDLIILDVGLPHMDGFDVVAALRNEGTRSTPLIVYTGRDIRAEDRAALRLGITRYVTKSRTTEVEFMRHVREMLYGLLKRNSDVPPRA